MPNPNERKFVKVLVGSWACSGVGISNNATEKRTKEWSIVVFNGVSAVEHYFHVDPGYKNYQYHFYNPSAVEKEHVVHVFP